MSASPASNRPPQIDGANRAQLHIARLASHTENAAVLIVSIRNVERLYAAIGHIPTGHLLDLFHRELETTSRSGDQVERIATGKFVLILKGLTSHSHIRLAAGKVQRVLSGLATEHEVPVEMGANIGVAFCPSDSSEATDLMRYAEVASINGAQEHQELSFYDAAAANQLYSDWGLKARLDQALQNGDLELYFQPKLCLESERIVGAEALMRWFDPEIGEVSPEVFIDLAEKTGQIVDVTQFAIQNVCRTLADWQSALSVDAISVNITPTTIANQDIVFALRSAASIWGVDVRHITLEVTESALIKTPDVSHRVLSELRKLGARVSIDDFGTGYSSLGYLKDIPADELKIDRSFVMQMLEDEDDLKIVTHTINIAKSFGLEVVGEGVETRDSLHKLQELRCDFAQGYWISKPLPAADFVRFYHAYNGARPRDSD